MSCVRNPEPLLAFGGKHDHVKRKRVERDMWGFLLSLMTFLVLSLPAMMFIKKYPRSAHWSALGKAFFLWLVSTSPVIGGLLLGRPTPENGSASDQFQMQVWSTFTINEMFIYAAAFLAPVLYVVFDIVKQYNEGDLKLDRADLAHHMRGMQAVVLVSIVILLLTLLAYASAKSDPTEFDKTYLALFLTGKGAILYFSSLLIWYSVILWETTPKDRFGQRSRAESDKFSDDYAKRREQGA